MATQIVMPQLGESVAEGVIGKWLKQEGDSIAKDEPIVEVVTDKVNAEIPSPVAGVLTKIRAAEGVTVAVGEEIAVIGDPGETVESPPASESASMATSAGPAATAPASAPTSAGSGFTGDSTSQLGRTSATAVLTAHDNEQPNGAKRIVRSSPLVQRLAAENNVDLALVTGTGIGGRVSKKDVLQFIQTQGPTATGAVVLPPSTEVAPAPTPTALPPQPTPVDAAPDAVQRPIGPDEEIVPISAVRRMIAEHMVRSKFTLPHATSMIECDLTNVVRFRDMNKAKWQQQEGISLSFMAFVAQATVEALKKYPLVNSEWGGDKIILKKNVNLGLAVAAADGLIVPNIKNADRLSLGGLAHAIADLTERARNRRLTPNDVSGGTFTLNNTGAIGSVWSVSIINYPQAGILSADAIVKRVRVMPDDSIAIRHMMNLCISFDHRTLDGATVSDFIQHIRRRLEDWPLDAPLH